MVENERLDKAIEQLDSMVSVMISDIGLGASYARVNSTACLDMLNLKEKLESMKKPTVTKGKKQRFLKNPDER